MLPKRVGSLISCLVLGLCFYLPAANAETPKFTAPEVNEYVAKQSALMDDYIAALKEGDSDKKDAAQKAMSEHSDKNMFTVYEKLTDAEKPTYDNWQKSEMARMAAAIKENSEK